MKVVCSESRKAPTIQVGDMVSIGANFYLVCSRPYQSDSTEYYLQFLNGKTQRHARLTLSALLDVIIDSGGVVYSKGEYNLILERKDA